MPRRNQPIPEVFHGIVTVSSEMKQLYELMQRVARTDASVLVRGETGTGKELVARALHDLSLRSERSFRAVNCATFTPELLASELFGHVKGAFTGAVRDRRGLFRLADGGTLFLDEVAEIPMDIQARLLRVLQERTFVPLGGAEPVSVDVRIVAATHRALRREVEEGRFREDLMYRIRVVPLFLPPLRERAGDVDALSDHFIGEFNRSGGRQVRGMSEAARQAMVAHSWPGNVRELRNVIEYAFAVGEGPMIEFAELPPELRGIAPRQPPRVPQTLRELERERILDALRASGGRKGLAASALGMSRSTLWRKIREHGLVD
jgi:two-component system response regulator AtoC